MTDTKARIFAAADEISAAGQNPTFSAIRKHLGSGSFSTISDAMTEWKAAKATKSVPDMALTSVPINLESFDFFRKMHPFSQPKMFNINVLKPHISMEGGGIIVYGAGDNCVRFLTSLFLRNIKANILCIIDADESKHGKNILGLPIVAIEELQKYDKQTPILITPLKCFRQIADCLKNMQFSNFFYYDKKAMEYAILIDKYCQKDKQGRSYFNLGGALLPDVGDDLYLLDVIKNIIFGETFLIPLFFDDNYDKSKISILDLHTLRHTYGYTDGDFDVTVKEGDVVIDAGAHIGDFAAYSANKGAIVYAFEPVSATFALLEQVAELNKPREIYPIKKGLCDKIEKNFIPLFSDNSEGNSMVIEYNSSKTEQISLTTLDAFVTENNIKKIDFIKADVEGSERDMLIGAMNVLKTFAPKLVICTYHLANDPMILENIILEANPKYKVIHLRHTLVACVV